MDERIVALLRSTEEALRDCLGGESAAVYRNDPTFQLAMDHVETVNRLLDQGAGN